MRKIWTIAKATIRDALRQRVLNLLLVFALLAIATVFFMSRWTPGEQDKMIIDIGIGAIWFFGVVLSMVLGAFMIPQEVERRTLFTVLSKPVRRVEFILGKYLGAMITLGINLALMTIVFFAAYGLKAAKLGTLSWYSAWNVLAAVLLCYAGLMILTMMAIVFSTRASAALSLILTAFFYIVGNTGGMFEELGARAGGGLMASIAKAVSLILPRFDMFDVRQVFVTGGFVPPSVLLVTMGYTLIYAFVLMLIGYLLFNEREV